MVVVVVWLVMAEEDDSIPSMAIMVGEERDSGWDTMAGNHMILLTGCMYIYMLRFK